MFYWTINQLILIMLSKLIFTCETIKLKFQSQKEPAAGKQITTSSGKIKLQQLFTTCR